MGQALTLVVHQDMVQIAQPMRMPHRANNHYCIHAGLRPSKYFVGVANGIVKCLNPKVEFVPSDQWVDVKSGTKSILKSHLVCEIQVP